MPFPSPAQVLTALELARQARIAANRAYLTGLGLGPQAMNTGLVRRSCHGRVALGQGESLLSWAGQLQVTGFLDRSLFRPAVAGMHPLGPLGKPAACPAPLFRLTHAWPTHTHAFTDAMNLEDLPPTIPVPRRCRRWHPATRWCWRLLGSWPPVQQRSRGASRRGLGA